MNQAGRLIKTVSQKWYFEENCSYPLCQLKDCTMEFHTVINLLLHSQAGTYDEMDPG